MGNYNTASHRIICMVLLWSGLSSCSLDVIDQTSSPARHSSDGQNSGYDIKANVDLWALTSNPSLKTNVLSVYGVPFTVNMMRSGSHPHFHYSDRWPLQPVSPFIPSYTGCGFSVHHTARATFLNFCPVEESVIQQIKGDQSVQGLKVFGSDWWRGRAFVPLTSQTSLVETIPLDTGSGLALANSYPEQATITSIQFLCDGDDCGSIPDPPITSLAMPNLPVILNCGSATFVSFSCTTKAAESRGGGKAKFVTSMGTVQAPFRCTPDPGA